MRKVGSEDDAVGSDGLNQANGVFFEEGVDPDVPAQDGDGVLFEEAWLLRVGVPQRVDKRRTQLEPFSTGRMRRRGNRDSMP